MAITLNFTRCSTSCSTIIRCEIVKIWVIKSFYVCESNISLTFNYCCVSSICFLNEMDATIFFRTYFFLTLFLRLWHHKKTGMILKNAADTALVRFQWGGKKRHWCALRAQAMWVKNFPPSLPIRPRPVCPPGLFGWTEEWGHSSLARFCCCCCCELEGDSKMAGKSFDASLRSRSQKFWRM